MNPPAANVKASGSAARKRASSARRSNSWSDCAMSIRARTTFSRTPARILRRASATAATYALGSGTDVTRKDPRGSVGTAAVSTSRSPPMTIRQVAPSARANATRGITSVAGVSSSNGSAPTTMGGGPSSLRTCARASRTAHAARATRSGPAGTLIACAAPAVTSAREGCSKKTPSSGVKYPSRSGVPSTRAARATRPGAATELMLASPRAVAQRRRTTRSCAHPGSRRRAASRAAGPGAGDRRRMRGGTSTPRGSRARRR